MPNAPGLPEPPDEPERRRGTNRGALWVLAASFLLLVGVAAWRWRLWQRDEAIAATASAYLDGDASTRAAVRGHEREAVLAAIEARWRFMPWIFLQDVEDRIDHLAEFVGALGDDAVPPISEALRSGDSDLERSALDVLRFVDARCLGEQAPHREEILAALARLAPRSEAARDLLRELGRGASPR